MSSGDSFQFPASDISLLVRDCNDVDSIYYPNYVLCIGTLSAHYQLLKCLKCCSQTWRNSTRQNALGLCLTCAVFVVILYNGQWQWIMEYRGTCLFFFNVLCFWEISSYIPAILLVMNVFLLVTCLSTMQMAELYLKIMFISVFSDYCTHVSSCIICSPQVTLYFILMVS